MPRVEDQEMSARVVGVQEIIDRIGSLHGEVTQQALRRSLAAGARVLRDEARSLVPVRTGSLKRSIVSDTRNIKVGSRRVPIARVTIARKSFAGKASARGTHRMAQGATGGRIQPRRYAHLVEFGTVRTRPRSFVRRALDTKRPQALAVVERVMREEVEKAARRAAMRGRSPST